jgi:transcriptional regulator with XRE-family HTH domain
MASRYEADRKMLGKRIRDLRESRGLRQTDVAEIMETDAGSVSRVENGKRDPSLRQLRRLARRFGLSPGQLLDGPTEGRPSAPRHLHEHTVTDPRS